MEEKQEIPVGGGVVSGVAEYWWWATGSTSQLTWAVSIYRKGYAGDSHLMPLKAFAVASLFIGATATAAVASLRGSGIESFSSSPIAGRRFLLGRWRRSGRRYNLLEIPSSGLALWLQASAKSIQLSPGGMKCKMTVGTKNFRLQFMEKALITQQKMPGSCSNQQALVKDEGSNV